MVCSNCGIEGIHACLGKPLKQEDLPEGLKILGSNELTGGGKKTSAFCEKCGGFVEYNKSNVLYSYPPKYKGVCKDCGEIHYTDCSEVS